MPSGGLAPIVPARSFPVLGQNLGQHTVEGFVPATQGEECYKQRISMEVICVQNGMLLWRNNANFANAFAV